MFVPCLVRASLGDGQVPRLGHPLLDDYLDMVAARARPNTVLATAFDLKVFFSVVGKEPAEIARGGRAGVHPAQRQPRRGATVVRIEDGEAGLSARTIKRRLASVTGLFEYLIIRGVVAKNPVPHGLSTRSPNRGGRRVPLIRTPRTLPRVIDPDEADALAGGVAHASGSGDGAGDAVGRAAPLRGAGAAAARRAARREAAVHRRGQGRASADRAGLAAILHQPWPPIWSWSGRERRRRIGCSSCSRARAAGQPLSAAGLDEIVTGARRRAGIEHLTCHQLRHTCFTRLREAGMALEAIQAQAGHRSIESTRIYLHLANDWLAGEYRRAAEAIDAQAFRCRDAGAAGARRRDAVVVEHYLAAMRAADRRTGRSTTRAARSCQAKIRRAGGWGRLNRAEQLDAVVKAPSFASWLMVTGRITVDAELLSDTDLRLGNAARLYCPTITAGSAKSVLGSAFPARTRPSQWNTLAKITAITGAAPRAVPDDEFDRARTAMTAAYAGRDKPSSGRTMAALFHRLQLTLFHAGHLTTLRRAPTATARVGDRMVNRRTGIRRDRPPLHRAGHREPATGHRQTHRTRPAPVRQLAGRHPPGGGQLCRPAPRAHRSVQDVAVDRTRHRPPANRSTGSASRTR